MLSSFNWIIKDMLAGSGQPGMIDTLENDVKFMKRIGIKQIVTLTEKPLNPPMSKYGFEEFHFAISDMGIPLPKKAEVICNHILQSIDRREPVLVHCKAGLGRTGTILACCLIHLGKSPKEAINALRKKNKGYIQTTSQEMFIGHYYDHLSKNNRVVLDEPGTVANEPEVTEPDPRETQHTEIVLRCMSEVPNSVAAGIVDLDSSGLVSYKTLETHPSEVIELLGSASKNLFEGEYVTKIQEGFKRARGDGDDLLIFKEIIIFSENLIHYFGRMGSNDRFVLCAVTSSDAKIGQVLSKARKIAAKN